MDIQPKWLVIIEVVVGYLIAFLAILRIVLQRREPTATLAWVLGIFFFPYVGVLLYILVGRRRLNRQIRKRRARAKVVQPHLERLKGQVANLELEEINEEKIAETYDLEVPDLPEQRDMMEMTKRMGCRPPTCGNAVRLLVNADEKYPALMEAIEEAEDHVHLLYYIYEGDKTGKMFRDLLVKKAREGVMVRVLTDGVGSYGTDDFMTPLMEVGGKHAEFLPVGTFSRHWHPNLRNHRKIAIIDGKIAFTGGVNIGDEYTGRKSRVGPWRDTHLRIRGPAVHHLQEVFTEDWFFATGVDLPEDRWYPDPHVEGPQTVQVIASGPDTDTHPIRRVFFGAVTLAKEKVHLTTPYFVPDQPMLVALETAALRGVDVKLLLPKHSDMRLVLHAGRSYYDQLLKNGVKIYEYQHGILHAKSMVVDDRWATVGSANMDVRSFRLNFEVNAVIFGQDFAAQLTTQFNNDLAQASQITMETLKNKKMTSRMAESLARVLSPVL